MVLLQALWRNRPVKATEFREMTQTNGHSRSFKVTNCGTSGEPVWKFPCVNNSNLSPVLHLFRDMVDFWSNFRCRQGCLYLTHLFGVNPEIAKFGLQKLGAFLCPVWSVFRYLQRGSQVWQTDGRTAFTMAKAALDNVGRPQIYSQICGHIQGEHKK